VLGCFFRGFARLTGGKCTVVRSEVREKRNGDEVVNGIALPDALCAEENSRRHNEVHYPKVGKELIENDLECRVVLEPILEVL